MNCYIPKDIGISQHFLPKSKQLLPDTRPAPVLHRNWHFPTPPPIQNGTYGGVGPMGSHLGWRPFHGWRGTGWVSLSSPVGKLPTRPPCGEHVGVTGCFGAKQEFLEVCPRLAFGATFFLPALHVLIREVLTRPLWLGPN